MWKEFKEFAMKGNVVDLAVAVIIGGAFGKIVSSLVEDIVMPIIGLLIGGIDFKDLAFKYGSAVVKYGAFLQTVVDFFIIAFSIFMAIKVAGSFKKKPQVKEEAAEAPSPEPEVALLTEIRDLLKQQQDRGV